MILEKLGATETPVRNVGAYFFVSTEIDFMRKIVETKNSKLLIDK